ncbi:glycerophosphodiester phosphodiesterase family protein [Clostridium pasteurianum]|uniref:Glycerophosphoryl diester phosphodiesterase n=1 Tax=Clostridium pasteurianum BC1 TaxID=86416 RepID=R4KG59_CLOPA|nr:glycerophosphodiester phosphodiesterase family protein [Clostridium pasteurianum]AGK98595.1 glycerophosphoryl diester phosphodiesterase [Clostridium pasteurianum BC1]
MNFELIRENIWKKKEEKKILIAAHRGTCGGNIVQNTIKAYENALKHGADIIEVDVIMSTDGDFYAFHNGMERAVIGVNKDIRTMSTKEIESYSCLNVDGVKINQKIEKLDNVLEHLKGRCLINIDRSWFYWNETIKALEKHNMADQIILKSHEDKKLLKSLEDSESNLMYMPIVYTKENITSVMKCKLNLIGVELIFKDLHSELIDTEYIEKLKSNGILTWVNAITLDDDTILSAGLDDNRAIMENEDESWGKLIDIGFDILQTDWPLLLKQYIDSRNAKFI